MKKAGIIAFLVFVAAFLPIACVDVPIVFDKEATVNVVNEINEVLQVYSGLIVDENDSQSATIVEVQAGSAEAPETATFVVPAEMDINIWFTYSGTTRRQLVILPEGNVKRVFNLAENSEHTLTLIGDPSTGLSYHFE